MRWLLNLWRWRQTERPIEVHLNTRGCTPMRPETMKALARMFKAVYEQEVKRSKE